MVNEQYMGWTYTGHFNYVIKGERLLETEDSYFTYKCSNCGYDIKVELPNYLPKTCPNCNAIEKVTVRRRARFG